MNERVICIGRWAGASLALATFIFFNPAPALASRPDSVPDWVRSAAAQTLPVYPPETNAVVLLDDTTYSVAPDGQATEHRRHVVKILRPQGRDSGIVFVSFDNDSKLRSLHVWSIAPGGHEFAVKDNEIFEIGYPGQGNFYADVKAKVARAPGRDPGGVVAYEYEQGIHPYLTETTWFFQSSLPHLSQSFTLELPAGFTLGTVWAHHPEVKSVDLEHGRWRWEMNRTPGIDLGRIPLTPSEAALVGRMTIHYAGPGIPLATDGSWQSIGQWYGRLSSDRLVPSPEAAAKARELAGSATDFYSKTEPIAEFVQKQIRYFVIERGIGGQQPHFAADIFRNRYGDCKDKATLLSAMLSAVGVHSALMMVDHRRGVVDPDAPSIVGDHMIAAIEIPATYNSPKLRSVVTAKSGRRYLIFDPTWEKTAFGQLENNLQGGYGVLMEGPDSQVVRLPILAPELNTVRRSASFRLQPDGSLQGTVIEKRFGDLSEHRRDLSLSGNAKEQTEFLDHVLAQDSSRPSRSQTSKPRTPKPSTRTSPLPTPSQPIALPKPWVPSLCLGRASSAPRTSTPTVSRDSSPSISTRPSRQATTSISNCPPATPSMSFLSPSSWTSASPRTRAHPSSTTTSSTTTGPTPCARSLFPRIVMRTFKNSPVSSPPTSRATPSSKSNSKLVARLQHRGT